MYLFAESRTDPSSAFMMPQTVATKPYDWTYTTTYPGGLEPSNNSEETLTGGEEEPKEFKWIAADPEDPSQKIPMAELTRPDPILFYAEIPLFEDELHDNGSSALLVRIVRPLHLVFSVHLAKFDGAACYARLSLHPSTIHPSRRQRSLPAIRYQDLPLFQLLATSYYQRNERLGSSLRTRQTSKYKLQQQCCWIFLTLSPVTPHARRPNSTHRPLLYRQSTHRNATSLKPRRRW
jgi:hypothetical protein